MRRHRPVPGTLYPMARRPLVILAVALVAAACSYETAGTTTTTEQVVADTPPATQPAAISLADQRVEGSSLLVEAVTLPAAGFVVVREDDGGSPGAVIGVSELLPVGIVERVPVPFFVPIFEPTLVHATVQIDMNEDGVFGYEPPDFVDAIATRASGDPASATAELTLLAALSPADAALDPQTTDGTTLVVASATLPFPGFVAIQKIEAQQPGEIVATTGLLAAGTVEDLEFILDPALRTTQMVYAVVYVDRNENGIFDPGDGADAIGVREDGTLAIGSAVVTVLVRSPASIAVSDQETTGEQVLIDVLVLPSAGFVEVLADDGGRPGATIAVSELRQPGRYPDFAVALDDPLADDATLWVRVWIDYDQDGQLSAGDLVALTEVGGDAVEASFAVTVA